MSSGSNRSKYKREVSKVVKHIYCDVMQASEGGCGSRDGIVSRRQVGSVLASYAVREVPN